MTSPAFAAQLSYASVDDRRGGDPRERAVQLLREVRAIAALRDAGAEWSDADSEAVVQIAVSDDGWVLTLNAADEIVRELAVTELRARFADAGMTLWLEDPASDSELIDDFDPDSEIDSDDDPEEGAADDATPEDTAPEELFAEQPVRVRELSHCGPMAARVRATAANTGVDYVESGEWSLVSFEATETLSLWPPSKAESPRITLNLPAAGMAWVEVVTSGAGSVPVPFWPNAERDTRPVLDLDAIRIPEVAATCRILLAEGDGMRDELVELARRCRLDVERAHRALIPEALGGVAGEVERLREFLGAFGTPATLIDAALSDVGAAALPDAHRFAPRGWAGTAGDVIVGGLWETTPLTRRERPLARLSRAVQQNPVLAVAISLSELAAGVVLTVVLRRGWKTVGAALVADALADLAITRARIRRR